jgi:hypothetical protein
MQAPQNWAEMVAKAGRIVAYPIIYPKYLAPIREMAGKLHRDRGNDT